MPPLRPVVLATLCAALFACASHPNPPPAQAPGPPVPDATNGIYRGTSTRFQSDARACPRPGLVTLYIQNGQFDYRWDRQTYVGSQILPDGEVHGQADSVTLVGRRDGKRIQGDVTNGTCGLHFTVTRQEF